MKKIYKINLSTLLLIVCSFSLFAQQNFFSVKPEDAIQNNQFKRVIVPTKYQTIGLDYTGIKSFLWALPDEKNISVRTAPVMEIPMPNGRMARFNVWESSIQEPGLEAKFPTIKTFAGQGIDDPYASIRFDYGPRGFHAQILTINGTYYIDPYAVGDVNNYISYFRKDLGPKGSSWTCSVPDYTPTSTSNFTEAACRGTELRTYRLAVACTGEYAQAPGINAGSNPAILHNAIVTSVNRVVGVYRTDLAISMTLVATNNLVEFLDAATDPFSGNNNANVLINESQTVCDNFIGTANYDIGHTFSTGGGGLAQLNSPCGPSKARGITGSPNPTGDGYDIDYVAHEIGHQFGGNHTMAGCGGSPVSTKLEVGSGTTIQAYAGICGAQNIQPNSDPFFHGKSFDEISDFVLLGNGNTCGVVTASNNGIPVINALPNNGLSIPISTPFTLSGTATDPDGDPLTYCWEQWDFSGTANWNAGTTAAPGNTVPLFKSRIPKSTGERTFPDIAVILAGYPANPAATMGGLKGETLSPVERAMKFKLTVRDNKAVGGGVASSGSDGCQSSTTYQINVVNTAAPFAVTVPNGGETYAAGSSQTITWNTVGTQNAPISVANVKISLSTDGGLTYPTVITASTPNDGSESLTIPAVPATTTARIKVEAVGNIFFDISNANFSITALSNGFDLGTPAPVSATCPTTGSMQINLTTTQLGTFTNPISFVATGNPGGTTVTFTPTSVTAGAPTVVTLTNTNTLAPGTYNIQVTGSATGAPNVVRTLTYIITPTAGPSVTGQPTSQSICNGSNTSFTIASAAATAFQWQVSTNGGGTWNPLTNTAPYSGVTTNTLTITGATLTLNNYQYRCVASIVCGSTNSNAATLTINTAPAITSQPQNATVCVNNTINFSVAASGTGIGYQWQLSTDGGASYNNLSNAAPYSGVTTTTLTVSPVAAGMNNYRYRCVITGTCPPALNSAHAILTVGTSVTITANPNNATICDGSPASFTAAGSGTGINYQWQVSTDGGANYNNLSNTAPYSGVNTATLNISAVTVALNNYRYRCLLSNAICTNPGITTGAILTVNTLPNVTGNPNSITACLASTVNFSAAGTGTALAYQWQVSIDGGANYTNLTNGSPYFGVNTTTLTILPIAAVMNNYRYRCVLSGACTPSVNTTGATLLVINPVAINTQPTDKIVCATLNTSFNVVATSTETITYQWQVSTDGGGNYSNVPNTGVYSGANTATLAITGATNTMNGYRYRVLTNNVTCSFATPSNSALLTVNALPVLSWPNPLANQCANSTTYALTGGAPAGGIYKGPGVTGGNFNASVAGIGTKTIWYIYTNASGCIDSISKPIIVNPFPVLTLTPTPNTLKLLPGWTTVVNASIDITSPFTTVWTLNGLPNTTNTGNSMFVNVDKLGTYSVVATTDLGCTSLPKSISILDSPSTKLFIYPSPNTGKFNVAYYNPGGSTIKQGITIYNGLGNRVFNAEYTISQPWKNLPIDLRKNGGGIYYIVVRDANGKEIATGEVLVK